jgi:hypothetical protein
MTKGLGIEGSCLNIIKAIFVLGWVGDAEDWIQDLTHVRQVLYHWIQ